MLTLSTARYYLFAMAITGITTSPISTPLPTNYEYFTADGITQGLNADQSYFTLNDKLVRIYSGAMHYFRVPRPYWRDRLKKIRAAGLNTVESYVPWNLHEPQPGKFDFGNGGSEFEDFLHLEEFLTTAQEEDLFVILRSGPYICAEYNFGGFPSWLLREKTIGFRTSEPTYMKFVTRYFNVLLTLLASFQFTKGGPIIAFQVENEYGNLNSTSFKPDKVYLEQLRQLFLDNGIVELLTTADSPLSHGDTGTLPGIFLQTANLGATVTEQLDKLEELQPGKPLMIMEYWVGWFDLYGTNHSTKSDETIGQYLGQILERNASFNTYMFLGGSNFAFNNGATEGDSFITTSYDYDAPLSENGAYTSKYRLMKDMVTSANIVKTHLPDEPEDTLPTAYAPIEIEQVLSFNSLMKHNAPVGIFNENLLPMEKLDINNGAGQNNGYILYRKDNFYIAPNSVLMIKGKICDHALVLVNGELIAPKQLKHRSDLEGFGYWKQANSSVTLTGLTGLDTVTLDILVENMGRLYHGKYDQYNKTFKGLWQGNVTINTLRVDEWKIYPLEFTKEYVNELEGWENYSSNLDGPTLYASTLKINGEPQDTFIDVRGWGKGTIFVNGFGLAKYAEIGPQRSVYLPAPFLQTGENRIIFLEHFYAPPEGSISFTDELIFDNVS